MAFVTLVVEPRLEREIAQWVCSGMLSGSYTLRVLGAKDHTIFREEADIKTKAAVFIF